VRICALHAGGLLFARNLKLLFKRAVSNQRRISRYGVINWRTVPFVPEACQCSALAALRVEDSVSRKANPIQLLSLQIKILINCPSKEHSVAAI
jgi:hypothetical protein